MWWLEILNIWVEAVFLKIRIYSSEILSFIFGGVGLEFFDAVVDFLGVFEEFFGRFGRIFCSSEFLGHRVRNLDKEIF